MGWNLRVRKSFSSRTEAALDDNDIPNAPDPPSSTTETPPPSNSNSSRPTGQAGQAQGQAPSRLSGAFYIPNAVATRASAYMRPDEGAALRRQLAFDALALVKQLPLAAQGYMLVKKDSKKVSNLFRSQWVQFWGELRGGMLLFFDPNESTPNISSESNSPDDRQIHVVFSATRCILDLKNTGNYSQIKLRREDGTSLLLRFSQPNEAQNWIAVLQTHSTPYLTVRLGDFQSITAIGKGASGKVFLVKDLRTNARLALKVVDKAKVFRTELTFQHVINERLVLEMCVGCPFLIQLRYSFQTDSHLYFATDFYDGGDVFSLLQTNKGRLSEKYARRLLAEVILALEWLHNRNIVYRDLKPENVVLDGDGHVRLADFGLAKVLSWPENHCTQTICGTTAYAAPEMLQSKPYSVTLDLWCLGVFMYHILTGRTPFNFRGRTMEEMEEMQRTKAIRYSSSLSLEAVALLKSLLQNDPIKRPTLTQIKNHRFFNDVDWVRVARREQHPDGLDKFVSDAATKEEIFSKLAVTQSHQIPSGQRSLSAGSSFLHSDTTAEVNSSALDKYLLRNINAEEWRNVSFSDDEDTCTVMDFPAMINGKGRYQETAAIAGWAWTCAIAPDGSFITSPPALNAELYETPKEMDGGHPQSSDSYAMLPGRKSRKSMPERRYSRAAGEKPEGGIDFVPPRMSFQGIRTSMSGRNPNVEPDSPQQSSFFTKSVLRKSFRLTRTPKYAPIDEPNNARKFGRSHTVGRKKSDNVEQGTRRNQSGGNGGGFLSRRKSQTRRSLDFTSTNERHNISRVSAEYFKSAS